MCTLCVQRVVCAISPSHRFNCGSPSLLLSFTLRLTRTLVFNCLQLSSIRWLLLHLRAISCCHSARQKYMASWNVKVVYLYFEQSSKKRALWPSSIRSSTNLSISGGRFLKLVIMRKSNTLAHTHTPLTHTVKKSTECANSWRGFFYLFFFFVSELSICKCICWCCCCVCQCICICYSLISLFALN